MIHHLSKIIADFLLNKNVIKEDDIEICIYGYESIILGFIDLIIVIIIGAILNQISLMILFLFMFITIRIYTGGYHANTVIKCKAVFLTISLSTALLLKLTFPTIFYIVAIALYVVTSCFLAPIENEKKVITEKEKILYKKISIIIALFWSVVAICTYFINIKICTTISVTVLFITLLMIIGKYSKRGEK